MYMRFDVDVLFIDRRTARCSTHTHTGAILVIFRFHLFQ